MLTMAFIVLTSHVSGLIAYLVRQQGDAIDRGFALVGILSGIVGMSGVSRALGWWG